MARPFFPRRARRATIDLVLTPCGRRGARGSRPTCSDLWKATCVTVRRPTEGDKVRRLAGWSVAVLLLALFLVGQPRAGPTTHPGAGPTTPHASALSGSARGHAVLALGDSVPAGAACDCQPFPETYGALLHQRLGVPVTVQNRAVSGLDTAG